ncbi:MULTISPECIES: WecB/TagA/CpsF family glycosyltransferase [Pseudomonadati]|uniref:WecB/TagA/CpsF family glycosyltransferase n=1 Tax=Pseudomonadati TaxID=3379134 RepID=UPI0013DF224B|nr:MULTISPECIES: WecB/TagA/CpsF family glycosyltransferase [Vibrio]MDW2022529.1 WecB/TagA/CpsF family glycosyltransferase [Vibrio sp. 397]MDW2027490.1 WecB/TagA/CpsF family glycosyltransferase [Vibrio sp. 399]MDW2213668.1 WecB/TagA/CpsF family glycosyltransferase [Vibrio sp. 1982]QOV30131.1 WecB/TagA/CpsF family glycosyltransferase [Vibrio diabolicus]
MALSSNVVTICDIDVNCFHSIEHAKDYVFEHCLETANVAVAINPEKIIRANESDDIKNLLNLCDFRYPDGIGVVKAIKRKTGLYTSRIPGCELWESIMIEAGRKNIPVFLLGAKQGVVDSTRKKLLTKYSVNVVGFNDGYFDSDEDMIQRIKHSRARILCVAMGSPRQEEFMIKCKNEGLNAFMMGLGGTFDVFTDNVKRAPNWAQKIHCEWLYRLLSQPTRIFRQKRLVKFLKLYLKNNF